MSTNHTPNYALSLWEATDQVTRTEFNENHAKIDAALAGKLNRSELLGRFVITEACKEVEFDLSGLDWNEWESLCLTHDTGVPEPEQHGWVYLYVRLNRGDINVYGKNNDGDVCNEVMRHCHIFFFPRHSASQRINAAILGFNIASSFSHSTFGEVKQLNVSSNENFRLGTVIELWGTR